MTPAELRALTAQGPAVVMVAKDDMLRLLDELERLRATPSAPADRLAHVTGPCLPHLNSAGVHQGAGPFGGQA